MFCLWMHPDQRIKDLAVRLPCLLQVGNGNFKTDDSGALSHFAMWCMLSAPLLAGNDLTKMSAYSKSIYTHTGLIAIDQDKLVSQSVVAREGGDKPGPQWQVWKKHLADGSTAALLLNRGESTCNVTAELADLGISGSAVLFDVWANKSLGTMSGSYTASLPPHGSLTLTLKPKTTAAPGRVAAYKCDSLHKRQAGRFQRRYLQLECALGQTITHAVFVPSCGPEAAAALGRPGMLGMEAQDTAREQIQQCVGERDCRIWLLRDIVWNKGAAAIATCE